MITAIILASGNTKIMGENKLLLKKDGIPMIEHLFKKLEDMHFDDVIVVTQFKYEAIRILANDYKFDVIMNTHPDNGISESIKLGVMRADKDSDFMFFVGDQPNLSIHTIEKLKGVGDMKYQLRKTKDYIITPIVYDTNIHYKEKNRKNPIIFGNKFRDDLLDITGNKGVKEIIKNNLDKVLDINFVDNNEFKDINTVEEYKEL